MLGAKNSVISRMQASWPATKRSKACWSSANSGVPSSPAQREVDVARGALALVELRHVGDRHALLGGDLLGAVLVDRVLVGGLQRGAVGEVDLVLAEVALALGVLHAQARAGHRVADAAEHRLDPGGAEDRVVDVVEVGRLEVAVVARLRLLVARLEEDELELGRGGRLEPALGEAVELAAQDLARRGGDGLAVGPREVGEAQRRALEPGDRAQRVEVRLHLEVAVAAFP